MELLLLFLPLLMANDLIPDTCSAVKIVCVGEGKSCSFDQINGYDGCRSMTGTWKVCQVCGEIDLTCHAGTCMRNIGSLYDSCIVRSTNNINKDTVSSPNLPASHLACRKGLSCDLNGVCQEQSTTDLQLELDMKVRGRGEQCSLDTTCVAGLVCDISRKCALPSCSGSGEHCEVIQTEGVCVDAGCNWMGEESGFFFGDSNLFYLCASHIQCPFGEYCSSGQCIPGIPYGRRLGAQCIGENSDGHAQCGIGMFCTDKNPFGTSSNYNIYVCKWFANSITNGAGFAEQPGSYSQIVGGRCIYNSECGKNMICSSVDGSRSVCSEADITHIGQGCAEDSECGRGLDCACPSFGDLGGGRRRCVLRNSYSSHNEYMKIGAAAIDYQRCLAAHKCVPLNGPEGDTYCSETHCKAHKDGIATMLLSTPGVVDESKSVCANAVQADKLMSKYEGVTLASGSQRSLYFPWSWGVSAIIALCMSFLF